jgi:hypothetical protein
MFTEKSKILELNRIKNLTEFGINVKECKIVFAKNRNYCLLHADQYIAIANLDKKSIESKYANEKNGRISMVKFTGKSITYLNQKDDYLYVVIASLGNIGEYYEYATRDIVLDYHYIESDGIVEDCLLTVNNKGEINIIRDLKKVITVNMAKDTRLAVSGVAVSHIEYIKPSMSLLLFLASGAILHYALSIGEEIELKYIDHTHIDAFGGNVNDSMYSKDLNGFEVTNFKFALSNLGYENYEVGESKFEYKNEDKRVLFFFSYNLNETHGNVACINSYIGFFGIEEYGLTYHNRIKFVKNEIMDSYLYHSNEDVEDTLLPSYLVIATRTCEAPGKDKIQIFASDFFSCFRSMNNHQGFILVNQFEDSSRNILELAILSVYITNNTEIITGGQIDNYDEQSFISDKNKYNQSRYVVNVILRLLENYNNYELYLNDIDIHQLKERIGNILTTDVNEYISKGHLMNDCFKEEVYNIILKEYRSIDISKNNKTKVDFFLLLLIYSNNLPNIKIYLSKKRDKEYLVPNENIFFTGNVLFNSIKNNIYTIVKSNLDDNQFFIDNRLYTSLLIIRGLFKISSKRITINYYKPFQSEENIISDDKTSITKALEEVEKIILLLRIARSYIVNIISKEENTNEIMELLYEKLRSRKEHIKDSKLYFELIMLCDYKDIYPYWKNIFINSFIQIFEDDKDKPDGQVNVYFSKLQLFFFYYYVVSEYLNLKSEAFIDNNIIKSYFTEMKDEWIEYSALSLNLYRLDLGRMNLELSVISHFLKILNKQNLQDSIKKLNPMNIHFNSTLIKKLKDNGFKREALELSKQFMPVIHNEEDLKSHLLILLENGLFNLGYQFLNYSFTFLIEAYDINNPTKLQSLLTTKDFDGVKKLYFEFFEYLIRNQQIDLLFCLPFNFIENMLLKIFLTSTREYEELLFLYYNKLGVTKEVVNAYTKTTENDTKPLYRNLLMDLNLLQNQKLEVDSRYRKYDNLFKVDYYLRNKENKGVIGDINLNKVDESLILGKINFNCRFLSRGY